MNDIFINRDLNIDHIIFKSEKGKVLGDEETLQNLSGDLLIFNQTPKPKKKKLKNIILDRIKQMLK